MYRTLISEFISQKGFFRRKLKEELIRRKTTILRQSIMEHFADSFSKDPLSSDAFEPVDWNDS